jgi:hypothetical protein
MGALTLDLQLPARFCRTGEADFLSYRPHDGTRADSRRLRFPPSRRIPPAGLCARRSLIHEGGGHSVVIPKALRASVKWRAILQKLSEEMR